jgi:hypothetical protein
MRNKRTATQAVKTTSHILIRERKKPLAPRTVELLSPQTKKGSVRGRTNQKVKKKGAKRGSCKQERQAQKVQS